MPLDIEVHNAGRNSEARWGRLNAAETFEAGQLVGISNAGELTEFPQDGDEAKIADTAVDMVGNLGGISAEYAIDRALLPGATTSRGVDTTIAYFPWNADIQFRTNNFWTAGGASAVVPALTDVGEIYQVTFDNTLTNTWGVEQTVGVPQTDITATILGVLDSLGRPVLAADTTGGTTVIFLLNSSYVAAT